MNTYVYILIYMYISLYMWLGRGGGCKSAAFLPASWPREAVPAVRGGMVQR